MKIESVTAQLRSILPILDDKYHVASLGIFGSVARGEAGERSDVDILVEFKQTPDIFEFIRLKDYLSSLLGCEVDLVSKKALKTVIRDDILREAIYV